MQLSNIVRVNYNKNGVVLIDNDGTVTLASGIGVSAFSNDPIDTGRGDVVPTEFSVKKYVDENSGSAPIDSSTVYVTNQTEFDGVFEIFSSDPSCVTYGCYKVKDNITSLYLSPGVYSVGGIIGETSSYASLMLNDVKVFECLKTNSTDRAVIDWEGYKILENLSAIAIEQLGAVVKGITITRDATTMLLDPNTAGFQLINEYIELEECKVENFYRISGSGINIYSFSGQLQVDDPNGGGHYDTPVWSPWELSRAIYVDKYLTKFTRCEVKDHSIGFYNLANLIDCVAVSSGSVKISRICQTVDYISNMFVECGTMEVDSHLFSYCDFIDKVFIEFHRNYALIDGVFNRCNNIKNVTLDQHFSNEIHLREDLLNYCTNVDGFIIDMDDNCTFRGTSGHFIYNSVNLSNLDFRFGKIHDDASDDDAMFEGCEKIHNFKFHFQNQDFRSRTVLFSDCKYITDGKITSNNLDRRMRCFDNCSYVSRIEATLKEEHTLVYHCDFVDNCLVDIGTSSTIQSTIVYDNSNYLSSCSVRFLVSSTLTTGFLECSRLSNCFVSNGVNGFDNCSQIVSSTDFAGVSDTNNKVDTESCDGITNGGA